MFLSIRELGIARDKIFIWKTRLICYLKGNDLLVFILVSFCSTYDIILEKSCFCYLCNEGDSIFLYSSHGM